VEKHLLLSFDDFEFIVITCSHCHSKIQLALKSELYRPAGAPFAPTHCSICGAHIDLSLELLERFHSICQALAKLKEKVTLQVRAVD